MGSYFFTSESINNHAESGQWSIYIPRLLQPVPTRLCHFLSFWACQIHKVHFRCFQYLVSFYIGFHLQFECKDWMWPWRLWVHECFSTVPILGAGVQTVEYGFFAGILLLIETFNKNSFSRVLPNVQLFVALIQEIEDLLIIDFKVGAIQGALAGVWYLFNSDENIPNSLLNQTWRSADSVCLPRPSLSIHEQAAIIAIEHVSKQANPSLRIHAVLRSRWSENPIISKLIAAELDFALAEEQIGNILSLIRTGLHTHIHFDHLLTFLLKLIRGRLGMRLTLRSRLFQRHFWAVILADGNFTQILLAINFGLHSVKNSNSYKYKHRNGIYLYNSIERMPARLNNTQLTPIYSPRSAYKRIKGFDERMIADMTLNFDKNTISLLKE